MLFAKVDVVPVSPPSILDDASSGAFTNDAAEALLFNDWSIWELDEEAALSILDELLLLTVSWCS